MEIASHTNNLKVKRLLIANRGEIVSRIVRTAKKLGIETVVIYAKEDEGLQYLSESDFTLELKGSSLEETYLNQDKIISLAIESGANAIHPGYGFLSENADFAQKCINNQLIWIGPNPSIMRRMADKTEARKLAQNINIPTVPAFSGTKENLIETLTKEDLPILLKAAAGGGGRGMRIVRKVEELDQQINLASREAKLAFGDGRLFIEKFLEKAKHIEVQILGDNHGNFIHLFERECTIQRRYQKIIEESPAASISESLRKKLTADAIELAKASGYNNAGTVEFLVGPNGEYYFIETNARIQVEHPLTEMVTGIDLVEQQIRIAEGKPLQYSQDDIRITGHAIECRICAENPNEGFVPSPGNLNYFKFNDSIGNRIDTALYQPVDVTTMYDSLIAKFIVHRTTREEAIEAAVEMLSQSAVFGIETNIPYLIEILNHQKYRDNDYYTSFISLNHQQIIANLTDKRSNGLKDIALGGFVSLEFQHDKKKNETRTGNPWKDSGYWRALSELKVKIDSTDYQYEILQSKTNEFVLKNGESHLKIKHLKTGIEDLLVNVNNKPASLIWKKTSSGVDLSVMGSTFRMINPIRETRAAKADKNTETDSELLIIKSPLPGKLSRISVTQGQYVTEGETLAIIESMKIENQILASQSGKIIDIFYQEGDQIRMKEDILTIKTK